MRLLDCFADWVRSRPRDAELCLRRIDELWKSLAGASNTAPTDRLAAVRLWIERCLDGPVKDSALEIFTRLEAELGLSVKT
jgi:hypothetical protein